MTDEEKIDAFCQGMKDYWKSCPELVRFFIAFTASGKTMGAMCKEDLIRAALYSWAAYFNTADEAAAPRTEEDNGSLLM